MRIAYFYLKIKNAWSRGTLREKSGRFLATIFRRPIVVLAGYLGLSKADRNTNIKDGFADHRQKKDHRRADPGHLRRIIAAYKASKQAQRHAALPYQNRGLWDEWISINHRKLIPALESEDIAGLSCLFENLFREPFTIGTGGYDDYLRYRGPLGNFYIKYVWSTYREKLLALGFDIQRIRFPLVGNPTGILINGNVISIETLRYAYHAVDMCELLRDVPEAIVVEIGGGLGGQAYQAMILGGERISKYLVFDLPEVAAICSYFLLSAFPDKRVRLFGEGPVSVSSREEYDVAVFPNFAIAELPGSPSVDLFYNSSSFSEMDGASSREYLSIIELACRKYFYHVNHDVAIKTGNPDGTVSVNVVGSKLIPNPAFFKRIFKKPRVHGLPEDRSFPYYEYLYERMRIEVPLLGRMDNLVRGRIV